MYSRFFFLPLLSIFLPGCRTEGISFNKVDRIIQYPYTAGSRIDAPPKGVCLRYAVVTQYQLKKLAGIASRIMIVRCYDGDRLLAKHAILVYRAANGNIHLADNNHEFPVLATPGGDDMVWANQMMDPMSGVHAVVLESNQRFGTIVSPQIAGIFHQHWINLRMDFDIDRPVNAVEECNTKLLPYHPMANSRGRAFTVERTVFGKERQAERNLNLSTNRSWIVYNPSVKSPVGHYSGYEIEPAGNTVSAIPEFRFGEESSFTQRHFWVTKYHPEQLYAAGKYPNQAPAHYKDNLFEYAKTNENIYKEDVVLWYSMGFTHITRPEDYPIMPAGKMAVNFTPVGFFQKSPALGYAHIEKEKAESGSRP